MNFQEAEQYLFSLGNEVEAMKLGLENIGRLLTALDNPEYKYLKVQVAGTNGKGSVCAFLDSICISADIKTGRYTSPHLVSITERIKIGGDDISDTEFARVATLVRETAEDLLVKGVLEYRPTFFEQVTAIALTAFAEAEVELAILETGLGGRFDATTAANAEIVAITPIDLDHQEYLGDKIEKIAAEKAAIIRKGVKAVIAKQKSEAMSVIDPVLSDHNISPYLSDSITTVDGRFGTTFRSQKAVYENVELGLIGDHQIENAKAAILLAEILQDEFRITKQNIVDGLGSARHPGRLEFVSGILFDGAHNVAGAEALAKYLKANNSKPITMIFGVMKDKDFSSMANILFPLAADLILTPVANSRSANPHEVIEFASATKKPIIGASAADAISVARKISDDRLIVVTGSLYLVGEVKKLLNN